MIALEAVLAALAIVGPTAAIATGFGWKRCGSAPWTKHFWQS